MSRHWVDLDDRFVIVGYDRPVHTFFAQLYDAGDDTNDPPCKAVGYHPAERAPGERTEHGPYPCSLAELERTLQAWGLSDPEREQVRAAIGAS
jgi:hypothetical protein